MLAIISMTPLTACQCGDALLDLKGHLVVSPETLTVPDLCSANVYPITLSNTGKGTLTVETLTVAGRGWTLPPVALPLYIAPGDSQMIDLHTTGGTGTLTITSNDPVSPKVTVPLSSTVNQPPTVKITSPTAGEIVDEGSNLVLAGTVSDDHDSPGMLDVRWVSSISGVLSNAAANPSGQTTYSWPAADRTKGTQTVTLEATDTCGATGAATVTFCQDSTYTYQPFNLQGWNYDGDTLWDTTNNWLQITNATMSQEGSAFQTSQIVGGDYVDISFQFYCSGGTGADGFALVALDTTRYGGNFLGADGCGMGFGADESCSPGTPLPGWAIEFDTYYNSTVDQTEENHTAIAFDGDLETEPAWSALPNFQDGNWHDVTINVNAPHVQVSMDGTSYIDQDVTGNFSFPAYVGFTGSTGYYTDDHFINSLAVTGHTCSMASAPTP